MPYGSTPARARAPLSGWLRDGLAARADQRATAFDPRLRQRVATGEREPSAKPNRPHAFSVEAVVRHGPWFADARVERDGYSAASPRALQNAPRTNRVHVRKTPSLAIGISPQTAKHEKDREHNIQFSPPPSAAVRGRSRVHG